MSDKLADRLAYREELVRQAQFLCRVIDSESVDPILRADAQARFDDISEWLAYADGPARQCNVVFAFCGYREMVEDVLREEFAPEFVAGQQLRVMWLRHMAELSDDRSFSDDFCLDCVDSLTQLLTSLRRCAATDLEYAE